MNRQSRSRSFPTIIIIMIVVLPAIKTKAYRCIPVGPRTLRNHYNRSIHSFALFRQGSLPCRKVRWSSARRGPNNSSSAGRISCCSSPIRKRFRGLRSAQIMMRKLLSPERHTTSNSRTVPIAVIMGSLVVCRLSFAAEVP